MSEYNGRNKHREYVEQLRRDYPSQPKQHRSTNSYAKTHTQIRRPKPRTRKNWKGKGELALLGVTWAITIGTGIYKAHEKQVQQNQPITLEQALENGQSLESLGISEETRQELINVQNLLENEEISDVELQDLAGQVEQLQFDVINEKTADLLGVEPSDIDVHTMTVSNSEPELQTISVKNDESYQEDIYRSQDGFDKTLKFTNKETISPEIADFIKEIGETQTLNGQIEDLEKEDVLKRCQEAIEKTSQFAAGKMEIDEKGNITLEQTTQKDLENKKANEKEDDGYDR